MDAYKTGQFIKQLRTERNLSQYQLADLVPITRQAVSKWERGVSLPDSSTLLILAKIFDVSVDELLIGERLNKGNQEKVEEVKLQMVDENISKGKKIKKIILINIITITLLVLLFFIYYFVNSYNSIKFYNVNGKTKNFIQSDGILIFTKQKIYFQSGTLSYNEDDIKIKEMKLYYSIKKKDILLFSSKNKNFMVIDYYGYNLFFDYDDIDKVKKNLYLEVTYNDNEKEKIHLNITNQFANDNFLFSKLFSSVLNFNLENTQKLKGILLTNSDTDNKDEDKDKAKENIETKNDIKTDAKKNFSKNNELLNNDKNNTDSKNNKGEKDDNSSKVNKTEEEYQKILQYLENKDLFIKMVKNNFILEGNGYDKAYSKKYIKDSAIINFSYYEAANYFNIRSTLKNKKYECNWMFDYDIIKFTIYENDILVSDDYIYKADIINKNEKYQLLANIIFEYLKIFLN